MLSHLVKWKHVSAPALQAYGDLGVHVFFVLSGYLISNLLLSELASTSSINLRHFYVRRAFRIFPAAFVFLLVTCTIYWREMSWGHVTAAFLYLANMDPTRPWIFGHLWSLSIEEQFYLLWPYVLKKWSRHKELVLIGIFAATPVIRCLSYALKPAGVLAASLPAVADQIAIGCLLAIFQKFLPRISGRLAHLMLLAAVLLPWYPANSAPRTLLMLFVLRPLLHVCVAGLVLHVVQVPYRALNWAPVVWLGKISYSLYLWQQVFCSNPNLRYGYMLTLPAIACACLSYYVVEQPMLQLRERLSHRPRATAVVLEPAPEIL